MKKILNQSFFTGLLVIVPIATTLWLIFSILNLTDDFLALFIPKAYVPLTVPGLGLLVTLFVILSVGFVARNILGRFMLYYIERIFTLIPVVNRIYLTVKQVLETFFKEKKDKFNSVVMIEFPKEGTWSIGFLTSHVPRQFQETMNMGPTTDLQFVFVPTTPNPTSGFLMAVEREKIRPINLTVEEAFKLIISVGVVHPGRDALGHEI